MTFVETTGGQSDAPKADNLPPSRLLVWSRRILAVAFAVLVLVAGTITWSAFIRKPIDSCTMLAVRHATPGSHCYYPGDSIY
jgi:hypothetical protein